MLHYNFNQNRLDKPDAKEPYRRKSPYYRAYGKGPKESLVPFGIGVYVMGGTVKKGAEYVPRAKLSCIVGYGPHGSYKKLDLEKLKEKGKVSIVTTSDLRITKDRYPATEMKFKDRRPLSVAGTQEDTVKCNACGKYEVTDCTMPDFEASYRRGGACQEREVYADLAPMRKG